MPKGQRKFADDGWAIWVDGDDFSTVYINDWLNPKGKSYVDVSVRIRGVKASKSLNVYIPFAITKEEIEDISLQFKDKKILQAIFSATCIVEYNKNQHTSEIAYNGKTIDIVHISSFEFEVKPLADGSYIKIDLEKLRPFLDNDEAYFVWRMPHKTLDEVFTKQANVKSVLKRLGDLITTPVVSEKYGYSIRVNESRLLPEEIAKVGAFNRQKLSKAVVTLYINEDYDITDSGCYRIRRLEKNLYNEFLPNGFCGDDVISYQYYQDQEYSQKGRFNFYFGIAKNSVSRASMLIYMILLLSVGVAGELLSDVVKVLINWGL